MGSEIGSSGDITVEEFHNRASHDNKRRLRVGKSRSTLLIAASDLDNLIAACEEAKGNL